MTKMICFSAQARRALLVLSIFVVGARALWAQTDGPMGSPPDGPPPGQRGHGPSVDQQLRRLTKALALSETQQTAVKTILTDEHEQVEALMEQNRPSQGSPDQPNSNPPSPEAMQNLHRQMKSIREAARAKIEAVLDDQQRAKYEEMEAKHGRMQNGDGPPPPPDGGYGPPEL